MNFFVRANDNPQIIVDFLSCYNSPEDDIEKELVQLVYYGKLSYIDTHFMTFYTRQFWLKEIKNIIEVTANNTMEF